MGAKECYQLANKVTFGVLQLKEFECKMKPLKPCGLYGVDFGASTRLSVEVLQYTLYFQKTGQVFKAHILWKNYCKLNS